MTGEIGVSASSVQKLTQIITHVIPNSTEKDKWDAFGTCLFTH